MSSPSVATLSVLLANLEQQLQRHDLWATASPPPAALASRQPFCIDTLSFPQWLQFVFISRLQSLLQSGAALPAGSGVAAMAEVYFGGAMTHPVVTCLRQIDEVLGAA